MSDLLDTVGRRHQEKLDQLKRGEVDEAFLDGIHALLADLREAGALTADPAERGQLRALIRFWGNLIYDHTGVYPDTTLLPPDPARAHPPEEPHRRPLPPLAWILVGGAAAIVIAVGLTAIGWMSGPRADATPTPIPTPTPAPFMSYAVVGAELDQGGALKRVADTFCLGIPEVVAQFSLENVQPEMTWRWEVQRQGEVVAAQTATSWEQQARRVTARVLTSDAEGVEPGRYDLLVYVGEQMVGVHSFRVLDTAPRVLNLRVTDVPEPVEKALDEEAADENEFPTGLRVIYLSYEYKGLCPGLEVSHTLYQGGRPTQERTQSWSGAPQGQAQVSFQAPDDLPFPAGDYEVAVAIMGQEVERTGLRIGQVAQEEVSPAFGGITIAQGVQPDGTPILTAPDNRFDWNTRVVYAIFDYVRMSDGLSWAAVWTRNGQEVARQEEFWEVEAAGTEGTRWVAHYSEPGRVLPGGDYSVTLYIDNIAQRTAEFNIRYYVPPQ